MRSFISLLVLLFLFPSACTLLPQLPSEVSIQGISIAPPSLPIKASYLSVNDFTVGRDLCGSDEENTTRPSGDLGRIVKSALQAGLSNKVSAKSMHLSIKGEIRKWCLVAKKHGAGLEVKSEAQITIRITNLKGEKAFEAGYEGGVNTVELFLRQSRAKEILEEAMSLSVIRAINDPEILRRLS